MTDPYDPGPEGAQMTFDGRMSYGDYLHLAQVLGAQATLSSAHDELLFIIQHQTSELWMKLALHELQAARRALDARDLPQAFKMLARNSRIFEQLNNAWDVLRTMTPSDYTTFREALGQSSGFQSHQYRMIEFVLGNRNAAMIKPHAHRPELETALRAELAKPSLYDVALRVACDRFPDLAPRIAARRRAAPHETDDDIVAMWQSVYSDVAQYWQLYQLAEKLVDLEDYFRRWRFNHVTTVERVIGGKPGTGGTRGIEYLRKMTQVVLFPDLWAVRTLL